MSLDDLLFVIIIIGIGLSAVYLKAEYQLHVRFKSAERRASFVLHNLHNSRVRIKQNGLTVHVWIARTPPVLPSPD